MKGWKISMINQGIKNFFISLKYFFTPLGTMFLGIMIGISFFIPSVIATFNTLLQGIQSLGEHVNLDFNEVWNSLWSQISSLNWQEPNEALGTLFQVDWLKQTLSEIIETILGTDFVTFETQIIELINDFTRGVASAVILIFIWWGIGFIVGYILMRFLIRRTIAKRGLWKYILSVFINALLSALYCFVCAILYLMWKPSIAISVVIVILLVGIFSLIEAYFIHGLKVVPFKEVVNFKNVGAYVLTNLMIFLIALSLSLLILAINILLGIFVALSLFEIAYLVISMNAESYVKELASKQSKDEIKSIE